MLGRTVGRSLQLLPLGVAGVDFLTSADGNIPEGLVSDFTSGRGNCSEIKSQFGGVGLTKVTQFFSLLSCF